jgi:hypothetical protein
VATLSRTPINDRRGKVYRIHDDNRTGEWLNAGVTMAPRKKVRPALGVPRHGKATPSYNAETRKIRNSLATRLLQHKESPCDGSGKQPNLHGGEPESRKPGSVNPRKH